MEKKNNLSGRLKLSVLEKVLIAGTVGAVCVGIGMYLMQKYQEYAVTTAVGSVADCLYVVSKNL